MPRNASHWMFRSADGIFRFGWPEKYTDTPLSLFYACKVSVERKPRSSANEAERVTVVQMMEFAFLSPMIFLWQLLAGKSDTIYYSDLLHINR